MEDFPLLILFFIIYLMASSSAGKKKKKRNAAGRRSPMRPRTQGEQRDRQESLRDVQTEEGFQNAFAGHVKSARCAQERMHLHEVADDEMEHAAEGDDPCHAGGISADGLLEEPLEEDAFADGESQRVLGQEVLRGVIMSEILTRPQERRAMQRSRQRTNGY